MMNKIIKKSIAFMLALLLSYTLSMNVFAISENNADNLLADIVQNNVQDENIDNKDTNITTGIENTGAAKGDIVSEDKKSDESIDAASVQDENTKDEENDELIDVTSAQDENAEDAENGESVDVASAPAETSKAEENSLEMEVNSVDEEQSVRSAETKIFTVTKHPVNDTGAETLVGEYDTFDKAIEACKQDDLGNQYIVTMNDNYTIPKGESLWGKSKVNITLRSRAGEKYTLKNTGTGALLWLYEECNFKAENVILDGNDIAQAFFVPEGTLTLGKGCIMQNFNDNEITDGPAIYVNGGTVNILDGAVIKNNKSELDSSGVIRLNDEDSTLNIYGGEITGNRSAYFGGVVLSWGNVNISGGMFKDNFAKASGGVIASYGGNVNITGGVFEQNSTDELGGAIVFSSSGAKLTVSGAEFNNNSAKLQGGAIYMKKGLASIDNSVFSNNEAEKGGGALFVASHEDQFNITESEFQANSAPFGGGIYMMNKTKLNIASSEFEKNEAAYGAGIATAATMDIDVANSNLTISDSIFNINTAWQGAGLFTSFPTTINKSRFIENEAILANGDDEKNPHDSGTGGAIQIMNNQTMVSESVFESNQAYGSGGAICVQGNIWDDEGNLTGSKENIALEISNNTSFLSNEVEVGQGGAIYFAPYQYALEITDEKAYKNLKTDSTTLFQGNQSGEGLFNPPANFNTLTELQFAEQSDVLHGILTRKSILNNYDVNYKNENRIVTFDANGGMFDDCSTVKHEEFKLGDKIVLPVKSPVRNGYTFKEWNTQKDGKGTKITEETVVANNMTVYAIYSMNAAALNEAPTLIVEDKTIMQGEELDLMSLVVSAQDKEDGDLKDKVELIDNGGFNKEVAGKYIVTFKVSDQDGASVTKKATITVMAKEQPTSKPDHHKPQTSDTGNTLPKTGESVNIKLSIVFMGLAGAFLIAVRLRNKRKES